MLDAKIFIVNADVNVDNGILDKIIDKKRQWLVYYIC